MKHLHAPIFRSLSLTLLPLAFWPALYALSAVQLRRFWKEGGLSAGWAMEFWAGAPRPWTALPGVLLLVVAVWLGVGAALLRQRLHRLNPPIPKDSLSSDADPDDLPTPTPRQRLITLTANVLPVLLLGGALVLLVVLGFQLEVWWLAAGLLSALCAFLGGRSVGRSFGDILGRGILVTAVVLSLAAMVFFWYLGAAYSIDLLIWPFFLLVLTYTLTQNQQSIDGMMERRRHHLSHLPRHLRQNGLGATGVVLVVMVVLVLLRRPLAVALGWIVGLLRQVAAVVLQALFWLLSRFNSDPATLLPNESVDTGMPSGQNGSPIWDYILYGLFALGAAAFIWYKREEILAFLRSLWRRVVDFILSQLLASPLLRRGASGEQTDYYADETVTLAPGETVAVRRRPRSWKKALRRYKAMEDGVEKLRLGFGLGLWWLEERGLPRTPDQTPRELEPAVAAAMPKLNQRRKHPLTPEQWQAVSGFYQLARYGEELDPAALPQLTRLLTVMGEN